ncbi:M20 family metallopeptidase [Thalassorhabdomicrobium marinisediminis]|uniref:M20 family metallopeptidase n=1 Tax=Thalassorhabdomicrobium marinisediminis TaxID=2170577 RepID=UPI002492B538|nr:M20 family metallopeptidase [Thalassorhabdomicrobium marinisediminis]
MNPLLQDVVALTRRLIAFDTINPPGQEAAAMQFCADLLREAGFECHIRDFGGDRAGLIGTRGAGRGICFSGHLDTVPLGRAQWRHPPFEGALRDGRLYGRGSSDMKGGVAAFMVAAARTTPDTPASIILTPGEETGCEGARWLVDTEKLPAATGMIVGESTDNQPVAGHKGVVWLKLTSTGRTAHGATPELGENAIAKMAPTLARLCQYAPNYHHSRMGNATCNVGTIQAGKNTNSVPDLCEVTVDLRSVSGVDHDVLIEEVKALLDSDVSISPLIDLPNVWTEPGDPWFAKANEIALSFTEHENTRDCVNYFTDASILKPAMGDLPIMILGPGQIDQPHVTDEYVRVSRLIESVDIYAALMSAGELQHP